VSKTLKILHSSDLHGVWRAPIGFNDFDVWVDSGDTMPNISRGTAIEAPFQRGWMTLDKLTLRKRFKTAAGVSPTSGASMYISEREQPPFDSSVAEEWTRWLAGRPFLWVPGNHDFCDLTLPMRKAGARAYNLLDAPVQIGGLRFAGVREIPFLEGEWAGEAREPELRTAVERVMGQNPDVLVTHAPPSGILDRAFGGSGHVGIVPLTHWLQWQPHQVRLVLTGHVHESAGTREEMGILFSNAACMVRMLEVLV